MLALRIQVVLRNVGDAWRFFNSLLDLSVNILDAIDEVLNGRFLPASSEANQRDDQPD
jgi:hypothetical protein